MREMPNSLMFCGIPTVVQRLSQRRHSSDSEMYQAEAQESATELGSTDGSFIKAKAYAFG